LVPGVAPGTLRLKSRECAQSQDVIQTGCGCQACRMGITRARLHSLLKSSNPLAIELVTQHNIAYMMSLVRGMRQAILEQRFADYVVAFIADQYPGKDNGGEDCPVWVRDALLSAGIEVRR
jgi:queuine tRNA-ribosyltransferase catalytic subunit